MTFQAARPKGPGLQSLYLDTYQPLTWIVCPLTYYNWKYQISCVEIPKEMSTNSTCKCGQMTNITVSVCQATLANVSWLIYTCAPTHNGVMPLANETKAGLSWGRWEKNVHIFRVFICPDKHSNWYLQRPVPRIQILSVYTDFLTLEFVKTQIFPPKIRQNTDFFLKCQRYFLILSIFIHIFSLKYRFFWSFILIFVSDHSGRSACKAKFIRKSYL